MSCTKCFSVTEGHAPVHSLLNKELARSTTEIGLGKFRNFLKCIFSLTLRAAKLLNKFTCLVTYRKYCCSPGPRSYQR